MTNKAQPALLSSRASNSEELKGLSDELIDHILILTGLCDECDSPICSCTKIYTIFTKEQWRRKQLSKESKDGSEAKERGIDDTEHLALTDSPDTGLDGSAESEPTSKPQNFIRLSKTEAKNLYDGCSEDFEIEFPIVNTDETNWEVGKNKDITIWEKTIKAPDEPAREAKEAKHSQSCDSVVHQPQTENKTEADCHE